MWKAFLVAPFVDVNPDEAWSYLTISCVGFRVDMTLKESEK